MKVFKITWQNCFMEEGTVKINATTQELAEEQFNKDFGSDYMIVFTKETK
jgi:hypothetical protein